MAEPTRSGTPVLQSWARRISPAVRVSSTVAAPPQSRAGVNRSAVGPSQRAVEVDTMATASNSGIRASMRWLQPPTGRRESGRKSSQ